MKKIILILTAMTLAIAACEKDDYPFSGDTPGEQNGVSNLKDPALAWSSDSFEATIGLENSFPVLTNAYNASVSYESSQPEVATISSSGVITLISSGSTLLKASSAANETYSASSASYLLTVVGTSGDDAYDGALSFASTGDPSSDDDISNTTFKGKITIKFSDTGGATVTGDSYNYVSVDGNNVTVNNTGGEVLIYELTGTTSNGFFKVYGAKKQAIVLNGVNITNPAGAAINNQNKKRTFIVVSGTNTLSDSESAAYTTEGEEDLKAVLFSEAQLIFSGSGDRAKVTGNAGNLIISGGTVTVNSSYGEGLEAKGDLTFDGGEIYVSSTSEDAINSQGDLTVNNGFIYAFSSGNDAMDSNGNTILNGGYVMAICTKGTPEVAIDANTEDGKKLYINSGATVVAYGGLERGYSASQSVYSMSGTAGSWNALFDGKSFIAAFKAPSNISSFIVSAPSLSSGYKGVSVSGKEKCGGIWAVDGISGGSAVSISNYSGGDSGPGGGWPGRW